MKQIIGGEKVEWMDLFSELVRFETELWDVIDKQLMAIHQLPLTHFEPMQVVARTPSCRVQDISAALSITVGGTSKLVDRIEAAGMCTRHTDPKDRRSSVIELTELGQQRLIEATRTFNEALESKVGTVLAPSELHQFAATVQQLRTSLRKTSR